MSLPLSGMVQRGRDFHHQQEIAEEAKRLIPFDYHFSWLADYQRLSFLTADDKITAEILYQNGLNEMVKKGSIFDRRGIPRFRIEIIPALVNILLVAIVEYFHRADLLEGLLDDKSSGLAPASCAA